jgi:large subunit ribosomal protein L25
LAALFSNPQNSSPDLVMAKILELSANPRTSSGTGAVNRMRKAGRIPAIIYGKKHANQSLELDTKAFSKILSQSASDNILVNLKITGEKAESLALVQEVQHDYLRGGILHVDFHAVAADEEIHASVPIVLQGVAVAEKKGGVMEHIIHSLEVHCLPKDLPETLPLEVSSLEVGESKHVSDLKLPEGVTTKISATLVVALLKEPTVIEEPTPAAPAEGAAAAPAAGAAAPAAGAAAPAAAAGAKPAAAAAPAKK